MLLQLNQICLYLERDIKVPNQRPAERRILLLWVTRSDLSLNSSQPFTPTFFLVISFNIMTTSYLQSQTKLKNRMLVIFSFWNRCSKVGFSQEPTPLCKGLGGKGWDGKGVINGSHN